MGDVVGIIIPSNEKETVLDCTCRHKEEQNSYKRQDKDGQKHVVKAKVRVTYSLYFKILTT